MPLRIVWVGRTKDERASGWIEEYRRRIVRHCPIEIIEVPDAAGKGRSRARREAETLASRAGGRGLVVLLDEGGEEMTSARFARFLEKGLTERSEVTFVLGGPEGIPPGVAVAEGRRLSLSRMTLTHEMARVVLLEQIYRAFSILKGTSYHR